METAEILLKKFVPVFNEHMNSDGDEDLIMTIEQAKKSALFLNWCREWSDDERGDLYNYLCNA